MAKSLHLLECPQDRLNTSKVHLLIRLSNLLMGLVTQVIKDHREAFSKEDISKDRPMDNRVILVVHKVSLATQVEAMETNTRQQL